MPFAICAVKRPEVRTPVCSVFPFVCLVYFVVDQPFAKLSASATALRMAMDLLTVS